MPHPTSDSATHNKGMGQGLGQSSNAKHSNTKQTIIPSRNNNSESTEQIASAISGLTMIINNVRGTMESSIQSTIGEFQSMAFQHNQTWNDRFAAFEKSVAELKDGVDLLNTNVNLLRNEQRLQVEEVQSLKIQLKGDRDRKDNDDSDGNSGTDTDIHQVLGNLLLDQRQWMVEQMQKQKDEMIAEVVQQLDSTSTSSSITADVNVNVDANTNANTNVEDEMICKSQALEEDVSIAIVECEDGSI